MASRWRSGSQISRSRLSSIVSPISARSTSRARSGAGPMPPSVTAARVTLPFGVFLDQRRRRDNGEIAVPAGKFDEGVAVPLRPARKRARRSKSRRARAPASYRRPGNAAKSMSRAPFLPATVTFASSAAATATSSAAGSRWHSEPPSVPRLRVCRWPTWRDRLVHQRAALAHQVGEFDVALARHRADLERAVVLADVVQAVDTIEVDDVIGQHVAHIEHRHQRLAAGEQFGVVEAREQADDVGRRCADRDRKMAGVSCRRCGRDCRTLTLCQNLCINSKT